MSQQREYTEFKVDGERVYKVTIYYIAVNHKVQNLVTARSPSEAVRIMQAEFKLMHRSYRKDSWEYEFKAERATVLRPWPPAPPPATP